MKICPTCQTQYPDDTLQFCLQDGTPLAFASQAHTPTVVLNKPLEWQQSQVTSVAATQSKATGSKMAVAVTVTVFIMLMLFAGGVGAWLYFRNSQTETAKNTTTNIPIQSPNANNRTSPTQQVSPSVTPSPTRTANTSMPTNAVDESQARSEVYQRLVSWKSSAESLDLDEYMAHYAGIVDYYRRDGASVAFVRADKLRAFTRYDAINIKLTNISISVDQPGQEATVTLDKEWDFEGNRSSSGKVKQLMKLRKFNGQWLITAEKDLKVYFTR